MCPILSQKRLQILSPSIPTATQVNRKEKHLEMFKITWKVVNTMKLKFSKFWVKQKAYLSLIPTQTRTSAKVASLLSHGLLALPVLQSLTFPFHFPGMSPIPPSSCTHAHLVYLSKLYIFCKVYIFLPLNLLHVLKLFRHISASLLEHKILDYNNLPYIYLHTSQNASCII